MNGTKFFSYTFEFFSSVLIHKQNFKITVPLPHEFKNIKNLSTVIVNNELVILGDYQRSPMAYHRLPTAYQRSLTLMKNPQLQDLE